MNDPPPSHLLQQIAQIQHLEPGKLCVMGQGPHGPYYNLQCRENGRPVSRYVPPDQVEAVTRHRLKKLQGMKLKRDERLKKLGAALHEYPAAARLIDTPLRSTRKSRLDANDGLNGLSTQNGASDRRLGA